MTTPTPSPDAPQRPKYADRAFRSPMGIAGGALLLALAVWLVVDAGLRGSGRTPLMALACLLFGAPLVFAFTVRPVVYVSELRMLVRNPFRTITVPWGQVESIEARFSTELVADGKKYQLWSVPVSMRARKRANRRTIKAAEPVPSSGGLFGRNRASADMFAPEQSARSARPQPEGPVLAPFDQAVEDLLAMARRHADDPGAKNPIATRWAYEVITPAVLGALAIVLVAVL